MNWYKLADLIDKGMGPEEIYIQCSYCKKWATSSDGRDPGDELRIWKDWNELSPQEKESVGAAIHSMHNRAKNGWLHISHGTCLECLEKVLRDSREEKMIA